MWFVAVCVAVPAPLIHSCPLIERTMRDHRQSEDERCTGNGTFDTDGEYAPPPRWTTTVRRVVGMLGLDKATVILMLKLVFQVLLSP